MTETAPDHPTDSVAPCPDDTAHLLTRVTDQLVAQLGPVSPNGTRRPVHRTRSTARQAPTLVAVAHGSRDPRAARTVLELLDRVRELRPGLDVRLGHIELNAPLLPATLDGLGAGHAVLVPLLLGRGHHVRHDLPRAAAAARACFESPACPATPGTHARCVVGFAPIHPVSGRSSALRSHAPDAAGPALRADGATFETGPSTLRTSIAAPLGPHPLLVEALYERLVEAGWRDADHGGRAAAVVLAAAGSRDPDSAVDARRTAALLGDRLGGVPVVAAYASAPAPDVPTALRALAARGRHRVAVASYFTAPGRFAAAAASAAPWIAAAPLGAHPAMARLLLHRYDQALAESASVRPRAHPPAPAPEPTGRSGGLRLPSAPGQGR
ncbi:sirohydrochlorin chelatase [Streptomyces sp. NPDC058330]|uniref:sirohydrochlorin chelatase n=1 Tax=Streptomyces sp. NPDC058330 TaxID=3346449 RepID=UPI0036E150D3